jgi:hypothetical protein
VASKIPGEESGIKRRDEIEVVAGPAEKHVPDRPSDKKALLLC